MTKKTEEKKYNSVYDINYDDIYRSCFQSKHT